jgi:hypothetical protein
MAPAGCRTHRHASGEPITKHDHLIHQHISHHVLAIPHHNMPCKNKLDVLYFVLANFTWLLWASYQNHSYLRKATMVIYKLPFNLLQGAPLSKQIQLRWERETPASHFYVIQVACLLVESVSCARTSKVGPGSFIPQYRRIQI